MIRVMPCAWANTSRPAAGISQSRSLATNLPELIGMLDGEAALLMAHLGSILHTVLFGTDEQAGKDHDRLQTCRSMWSIECRVPGVHHQEEEK